MRNIQKHFFLLFIGMLIFVFLANIYGCDNSLPNGLPGSEDEIQAHPTGWDNPQAHGISFFENRQTCEPCHGQDLTGGTSQVSCDQCHHSSWREDCTFCHGGEYNQTGAPPKGIQVEGKGFPHNVHVIENDYHIAFCDTCHLLPDNMDSPEHIDGIYGGEISAEIKFKPFDHTIYDMVQKTCTNIYCHGNGQESLEGPLSWQTTEFNGLTCTSCHEGYTNSKSLSGAHNNHLKLSMFTCSTCHSDVILSDNTIKDKSLHINGQVDILINQGNYNKETGTCSVSCHQSELSWK